MVDVIYNVLNLTPYFFLTTRMSCANGPTRISDTKSSCNKNVTLLHYIADTCESKARLLNIFARLPQLT